MPTLLVERFAPPVGARDTRVRAYCHERVGDGLAGRTIWCTPELQDRLRQLLRDRASVRSYEEARVAADDVVVTGRATPACARGARAGRPRGDARPCPAPTGPQPPSTRTCACGAAAGPSRAGSPRSCHVPGASAEGDARSGRRPGLGQPARRHRGHRPPRSASAGAAMCGPRSRCIDMALTLEVTDEVPREQRDAVRQRFDPLSDHDVHAAVRRACTADAGASPFVVDASLHHDGRTLAAHASGPNPKTAAERAAERLRRQLRRAIDADVTQRDDPRTPRRRIADLTLEHPKAPRKPPDQRQLVRPPHLRRPS